MTPKTRTTIVIIAGFVLGCIVGAAFLSGTWRSLTRSSRSHDSYRSYMYERLDLDAMQIGRVDSLLDEYRHSIDSYRASLQLSRDSLRTEIRALLTPPQVAEYELMIAEMSRRGRYRRSDSVRTQ